jgi:hypothetical protein
MNFQPIHFFGEPIEAHYHRPPALEKKPGLPDAFTWRERRYRITELLSEWHDYQRRGRYSRNMRDTHLSTASGRGSWGVGQDYYRIIVDSGQIFDIYYDRAPKGSDQRKGAWFLDKELSAATSTLLQDDASADQADPQDEQNSDSD